MTLYDAALCFLLTAGSCWCVPTTLYKAFKGMVPDPSGMSALAWGCFSCDSCVVRVEGGGEKRIAMLEVMSK